MIKYLRHTFHLSVGGKPGMLIVPLGSGARQKCVAVSTANHMGSVPARQQGFCPKVTGLRDETRCIKGHKAFASEAPYIINHNAAILSRVRMY